MEYQKINCVSTTKYNDLPLLEQDPHQKIHKRIYETTQSNQLRMNITLLKELFNKLYLNYLKFHYKVLPHLKIHQIY